MKPSGFRPQEGARHAAALYRAFRPDYPPEVFRPLARALLTRPPAAEDLRILDLGCGAGQAARALVGSLAQEATSQPRLTWVGVDPNSEMIQEASECCVPLALPFQGVTAPAEETDSWQSLGPFAGVIFAASLHWLDLSRIGPILRMSLASDASLFFVDYPFPGIEGHPELDSWLRDCFRTRWYFAGQKPRGRFRDLVKNALSETLGVSTHAIHLRLETVTWKKEVTLPEFEGLLCSQARVLASVERDPEERARLHDDLKARFPARFTLRFQSESFHQAR